MDSSDLAELSITNREKETDSPVEAMVKKAISQVTDSAHDECANSSGGMSLNRCSNDPKSYEDTELFRQLSQIPLRSRYHSQSEGVVGAGETPRHNPVHDVNHWKALPNPVPRPNDYIEATQSPAGSSSAMSYSEDSCNSNSNQSMASQKTENNKTPLPPGYMGSNAGQASLFDFNLNSVQAFNSDPCTDAEVQFLFHESHNQHPSPQQQYHRSVYQDKSPFYSTQSSPGHSPGYEWNHQQQGQGWSNVPRDVQPHHRVGNGMVQQQQHMVGNGYQISNGVIQPQQGTATGYQHIQISNGVIQPQQGTCTNGFQQQSSMTGMHQPQHCPPPQQQGSLTNNNIHTRANPPRYINLEMCNSQAIQQQQSQYSPLYPPPSPFLQQYFDQVSPSTPPFHQLQSMLMLQRQQIPQNQPYQPNPPIVQHGLQSQQVGQSQCQPPPTQTWTPATPQKKARISSRSTANATASPKPNAPAKAVIHYRPSPQKSGGPAMVPVTDLIKNNNARIATIVSEASMTSDTWKQPKDSVSVVPSPTRYILVQNPSGKLGSQSTVPVAVVQQMLSGGAKDRGTTAQTQKNKILAMSRSGPGGSGYRVKIAAAPARPSSPVDGCFGNIRKIASDPSTALKEILKLRLLLETQSERLMHACKEIETYRTVLAISEKNPYKIDLVKLCTACNDEQKAPDLKAETEINVETNQELLLNSK